MSSEHYFANKLAVYDLNGQACFAEPSQILQACINYEVSAGALLLKTGTHEYQFTNGEPLVFELVEVGVPALRKMDHIELASYWNRARGDYMNLMRAGHLAVQDHFVFYPIHAEIADQVMEDLQVELEKRKLALSEPEIFSLKDNDTIDAPEVRAELHTYDHCVELLLREEGHSDDEARIVRLEMDGTQLRVMCANQSKEAGIVIEIPELGEMNIHSAAYYRAPFVDDPEPCGP